MAPLREFLSLPLLTHPVHFLSGSVDVIVLYSGGYRSGDISAIV